MESSNTPSPRKYKYSQDVSAGGVVIKRSGKQIKFLVIHRNKMNDWSLPKGHKEREESLQETATREVMEEATVKASPLEYIGENTYKVISDSKKTVSFRTVHWFLMKYRSGKFNSPTEEVLEIKWCDFGDDLSFLNYQSDRDIISKAKELLEDNNEARVNR